MFMQQKKVEIIIEAVQTPTIINHVDALGLLGYSIIHNAEGRGTHGIRDAQEITDVLVQDYLFIICSVEQAQSLLEKIAPILKKFGGICYLSDVQKFDTK